MATLTRACSRLLLAMFLFLLGSAVAHAGSPIEGRWNTPKQEGTVEVTIKDGVLTGKLVESTNPQAELGTVILHNFVLSGDKWVGKIYLPKKDRKVDAELTSNNGKLEIKISAGLRTKSVVWTRAKSVQKAERGFGSGCASSSEP